MLLVRTQRGFEFSTFMLVVYFYFFRANQEEYVLQNENSTSINDHILTNHKLSFIIPKSLNLNVRQICILIYVVITISMIVSLIVRASTVASFFNAVSMNLHRKMFNAVVRATMYFFNTNSSG